MVNWSCYFFFFLSITPLWCLCVTLPSNHILGIYHLMDKYCLQAKMCKETSARWIHHDVKLMWSCITNLPSGVRYGVFQGSSYVSLYFGNISFRKSFTYTHCRIQNGMLWRLIIWTWYGLSTAQSLMWGVCDAGISPLQQCGKVSNWRC